MNGFLLVALGGAIGASLRYGVGLAFTQQAGVSGAWATLCVNLVGSFCLGVLLSWVSSRDLALDHALWLFFGIGMMGAFTTFSAFSKDAMDLLMTGEVLKGTIYIGLNLIGALSAFAVGLLAARRLLA